jgi:hypothetical protein
LLDNRKGLCLAELIASLVSSLIKVLPRARVEQEIIALSEYAGPWVSARAPPVPMRSHLKAELGGMAFGIADPGRVRHVTVYCIQLPIG